VLDPELERLRRELPEGWRAGRVDGQLYAKRGKKRVEGETADKVIARAILRDSDWMRR
jgi:hypothetical protein